MRVIKGIALIVIFLFMCIALASSTQASTNGPEFSISKMNIIIYYANPYVPVGVQLLRCEVKYIGNMPTNNINYRGKAFRYSLIKEPYLAGSGGGGSLLPPSEEWQPNETRVLDIIEIYDKPFLKYFPIIYHLWIAIWTGFQNYTPEDIIIDSNFLIWHYTIIPI